MTSRSREPVAIVTVGLLATLPATFAAADDCHHNNRVAGTVLGAVAGGVIGGAVTHGSGLGIVGGVVLGGLAGNAIAGDIDCDDRPYAYRTYREGLDGRIGERYEWHHRGHHGYIVSNREYWRGDRLCRDFTVVTYRHGDEYTHDGTACRYQDGNWHFV